MKKIFYIVMTMLFCHITEAQTVGVEKSIFTIETGVLGIWFNNESRLSNDINLKSEIGMIAGFHGCSDCGTDYALAPILTLEPRWYYNIEKRNKKGKTIKNNSANFVALAVNFIPDWFVISNQSNSHVSNQLTIIPKWGIKRTISNSNFNYELGIGLGKRYYFDSRQWETAADLLIRVGYSF